MRGLPSNIDGFVSYGTRSFSAVDSTGIVPQNWPQQLPSTFFLRLFFASLTAISQESELLTVELKKQ